MTAITEIQPEQKASRQYQKALKLMQKSEANGYQEMVLLQEAHGLLQQALREQPEFVESLSLMAHLMYLLDCPQLAQRYLTRLFELEPQHEHGLSLQAELDRHGQLSPLEEWWSDVQAYEALPRPESSDAFDFVYDETEAFLERQVRFFMQQQVSPELILDPEGSEAQQQLYSQLLHVQTLLDDFVPLLAEEFEAEELEQLRKPLTQLQLRYEKAVWFYGVFDTLLDACHDIKQDTIALLKELKTQPEDALPIQDFDHKVQALFESLDSLADDLDSISSQVPITGVEPYYEEVLRYVQHLQDTLDQRYA